MKRDRLLPRRLLERLADEAYETTSDALMRDVTFLLTAERADVEYGASALHSLALAATEWAKEGMDVECVAPACRVPARLDALRGLRRNALLAVDLIDVMLAAMGGDA